MVHQPGQLRLGLFVSLLRPLHPLRVAMDFDVRQVEFIPRNAGTGSDFFTVSLRVSRSFHLAGGSRIEGLIEAFNLTDRVNPITRNTTFGPGPYPSNPVPSFGTVTAVGDPRTIQFGVRFIF